MYINETQLHFVSFNDKNLQRRRKCVGERDLPIQNSFTGQVQCLSHSRDQTLVTSLVQSAIESHTAVTIVSKSYRPTFDDFSKNEEDSFAKNVPPHLLTSKLLTERIDL